MTLSAILFDIDDTLYPSTEFADAARRSAVEAMVAAGLEIEVDVALEELHSVVEEFTSNHGHHFDQLVVRLSNSLRLGVHPALIVASGVRAYHETKATLKPFPDAVRILKDLRSTNLMRGALTNGLTIKQAEKLVRLEMQDAFSPGAIFISGDLGVAKPHPRIFEIACDTMKVLSGETLYVGDNPIKDVDAAHNAGLMTCLRRGSGKHSREVGAHAPDLEVESLDELRPWLEANFGVVFGD